MNRILIENDILDFLDILSDEILPLVTIMVISAVMVGSVIVLYTFTPRRIGIKRRYRRRRSEREIHLEAKQPKR
jgi:uncharacterized integral membrane protein